MRVGTAFRYDQLAASISSSEAKMLAAQNRAITGKRINAPSDDASGTRQLLGIGEIRKGIAAYTKNLDVAKGSLTVTDATYGDMGELMQQAQSIAVEGANTTLNENQRANLVAQIGDIQMRLVSLGNSQGPDGRYLFSGQATDTKPFSVDTSGALSYAGNAVRPALETGPGETAKVGETGGVVSDAYASLAKLKDSLNAGDVSAISNGRLDELKTSADALVSARADVGRQENALDATRAVHGRRDAELEQRASDIGEVDYASALVDYTAAQSAYDAAIKVASKGFTTGLMDYIR